LGFCESQRKAAHFLSSKGLAVVSLKFFNMETNAKAKGKIAHGMCEKELWPEVLAFAQKWREKDPSDYQALYYIGLGLSGMGQFAMAETAYRGGAGVGNDRCPGVEQLGGAALRKIAAPKRGHPLPGAGFENGSTQ
jgi:hypothetical protein